MTNFNLSFFLSFVIKYYYEKRTFFQKDKKKDKIEYFSLQKSMIIKKLIEAYEVKKKNRRNSERKKKNSPESFDSKAQTLGRKSKSTKTGLNKARVCGSVGVEDCESYASRT